MHFHAPTIYNCGVRANFISTPKKFVFRFDWMCVSACEWWVRRDVRRTGTWVWVPLLPLPSTLQYALSAHYNYQSRLNADVHDSRQSVETRGQRIPRAPTQKLPLVIIKDVKWIGIHIRNCSFPVRFFPASVHRCFSIRIGSSQFFPISPPAASITNFYQFTYIFWLILRLNK